MYTVRRRFFDHTKKRVNGKQSYYEPGDSYSGAYAERYVTMGLVEKLVLELSKPKKQPKKEQR